MSEQQEQPPKEERPKPESALPSPDTKTIQGKQKRKRLLIMTGLLSLLLLAGYTAAYLIFLMHYEHTDNAYVQSDIIQITPQVSGTVLSIDVRDTDFVKEGQALLRFDKTDAQMALEQAEANLAQAVRTVRSLYTNNRTFSARIKLAEANLAEAGVNVQKAQGDVTRRMGLGEALSQEELAHAQAQLAAARSTQKSAAAAVNAAQEQLKSNQSMTEGVEVLSHPDVLAAKARLKEAYITLNRMTIPAPTDGYIARRSVQIGQKVNAGAPLMSVIPLREVWVDANFKEVQLQKMRIGQKVELTADIYGKKIKYQGTVDGISAGTGSVFSLLPAQNATGNWIKVVQRLPVRIKLDAQALKAHPLQVGLSMQVTVDTKDQSGKMLADAISKTSATRTRAFKVDQLEADATEYADKIISQHLGYVPKPPESKEVPPLTSGKAPA